MANLPTIKVTPNAHDSAIVADVVATLKQLVDGYGVPLFATVVTVLDPVDFVNTYDALAGQAAAVVARPSERLYGVDNGMAFMVRVPVPVIIAVPNTATPNLDTTVPTATVDQLAEAVREGLLIDPTRSGYAHRLVFRGQYIDGTSIDGVTRSIKNTAATITVGAEIPVTCAWQQDA